MSKVLNAVSTIGALVMAATPLVAIGGVARAQAPQTIRIADLDLSRPSDVARFNVRVDQAAERMCVRTGEMTADASCRQAVREEAAERLATLRARTQTASAN